MSAPRIFLIAGEPSGDLLGAALMRSLAAIQPDVAFEGVGGEAMQGLGLASRFPMGDITAMGFGGVIGKLPLLLRRIDEAAAAIVAGQPDVLVVIDSPDFNLRVARKVRTAAPTIPIVKYVAPTVWAWRPGRAKAMRRHVDAVLALFPFEPDVMAQLGGPPTHFVGHPLVEKLAMLTPSPDEVRERQSEPPLVLALPGSRSSELKHLGAVFGAALARLSDRVGGLRVVVPTLAAQEARVRSLVARWPIAAEVITGEDAKYAAFRRARAALAASGTVTLELALAGVPAVVAYRGGLVEGTVARLMMRAPSMVLPNLVMGKRIMPEFIMEQVEPDRLSEALLPLLTDSLERRAQCEALTEIGARLTVAGQDASMAAARVVLSQWQRS